MGDGARCRAAEASSPSCWTGRRRRKRCSARGSSSPSPSRRLAASRCRPSTPSASGCCSASRSRPACRRASPSSTTTTRAALLAEAVDEMLTEATARRRPVAAGARARGGRGLRGRAQFDDLLAEAMRQHEWLDAAARLDRRSGESFAKRSAIYRRALCLEPDATLGSVTEQLLPACSPMPNCDARATCWRPARTNDRKAADASRRRCAGGQAARVEALCKVFPDGQRRAAASPS